MSKRDFPYSDLNPEQLDGVIKTDGPVLVLAGAGSGKTRVLTYKIAYLIDVYGIKPENIFATTFTNKAAEEMKNRVEKLVGKNIHELWIGTFHSLCGRILRTESTHIGLSQNFSIYDEEDSVRAIRHVMENLGFDRSRVNPRMLASKISSLKEKLITPEYFTPIAKSGFELELLLPLYKEYQKLLLKSNAVDFDDMIMYVVLLFKSEPDIEYKWSSRFKYILVDEFQDTNLAQYELIKHLSKVNGNITVVGDDDQSIYGWRGAEIRNILNFPIDFKNTKIVKLEKNYRSTKRILELANCVIKNNKLRHEKVLWCDNEVGQKPVLKRCLNEIDEAIEIADEVERILDEGIEPNKLAILYRTNAQSRVFEEEFKRRGIPYQVVGGISFYERAEIKDMLAYLRLVVNPKDDISFRRIANIPARGIGKSSLDKLSNEASLKGLSLYESAKIHCDNIPISASAKKGLANLVNIIEEAKRCAHNVYEALKNIVDNTGYIKMLEAERIAESEDRIGNIYELLSSAYSFVNSHADAPSVERYLSEVSLLTSVDLWEPDAQRVSLMTVHSAKGLEFEYLFVSGLEDGLFPLADAYIDVEKLEEERRLFYVATTRAKKILHLSYALSRRRHGEQTFSLPSKFILEIPKELLYEEKKEPEPQSEDNFQISINSMVYHSYFGRGKVIEIRGYGKNAIVTVYFEEYGIVKLSLAHTQLEVL